VIRVRLGDWRSGVQYPRGDASSLQIIQAIFEAHPVDIGDILRSEKGRRREANHSPPSNIEVNTTSNYA
jgi:hypothetical protein